MSPKRRAAHKLSSHDIARLSLMMAGFGLVLFSLVWWPIQSERARVSLANWENDVSRKKSELNELKTRYIELTSLNRLDQWAKKNGPWKSPNEDDILTLQN